MKPVKFCPIYNMTYLCLLLHLLFLYILDKFWCQDHEDGETITQRHVGYIKNSENKLYNRAFVGDT
jgi:hypothetical protein